MSANQDLFGHQLPDIGNGRGQLPLPLGWTHGGNANDDAFILGESNSIAARYLAAVASWPLPVAALVGPRRSGRSTLAGRFMTLSGGDVIDVADQADQHMVFHAWNRALADARPLLLVATLPVAAWPVDMPDLRTRLAAVPTVTIGTPDLPLAAALIERLLEQRGMAAAPGIGRYAAGRIERSYAAIHAAVDAITMMHAARGGRITTGIVRDALTAHHLIAPMFLNKAV